METHRMNRRIYARKTHANNLSGFEDDLRKAALEYYVKQLKQFEPQLRKQGQSIAKKVLTVVPIPFYTPPKGPPGPPAPKPPSWVGDVANPIVKPVLTGFKQEIMPPIKRFALIAGVGLLGVLGLTFYVGYRTGKNRGGSGG
jgi:hypothetical protein